MKVRDTNHVTDFHDLCPRQVSGFVVNLSRTSLRTLSPTFPAHCNGLNSIRATQTDLSQTCHGLCVRNFRDLCRRLSTKLHGFMICHRFCPRLSSFVSTTLPAGNFWKSRVIEFGPNGTGCYWSWLLIGFNSQHLIVA